MLLTFTDAQTGSSIAVNPNFVVVVFTGKDESEQERTVINTTTGNLLVAEDYITVVGQLQGQLQ
jgi:hypothetical protein